jgi:RNA polymerase sigma-70 factor (ECF subfamily)
MVQVNGQPGAMVLDPGGRVIAAMSLDVADGRVQAIRSVVNPDKLAHLGEVADVREYLTRGKR